MTGRIRILIFLLIACSLTIVIGAQDGAGQSDDGVEETRRLLKTAVASIGTGEYPVALAALDSVTVIDATNADSFYYRGLALLHSGDTTGARQTLTEGTQAASLSSRIRLLLARLLVLAGEYEEAILQIDYVLAIKPRQGEAHYLKGMVQVGQGDTAAALKSFEKSLELALPEGNR